MAAEHEDSRSRRIGTCNVSVTAFPYLFLFAQCPQAHYTRNADHLRNNKTSRQTFASSFNNFLMASLPPLKAASQKTKILSEEQRCETATLGRFFNSFCRGAS